MLSRNAFNALLKTLEEPPAQVTFIFATTELRKVPVTVLSRCQTFALRRVPQVALAAHFDRIAQAEDVRFSPDALSLIARAADGSVRDGLSLLDQAIAQGTLDGEGGTDAAPIGMDLVADMLGLADRGLIFDLLDAVLEGKPERALEITTDVYERGGDLGVMLGDVLELVHTVSRIKAIPALRDNPDLPEAERQRGAALAERVPVPVLGRTWQMLLKGLAEVEQAPDRRQAAEMILIRLCYVADLPPPGDLVRRVMGQDAAAAPVQVSTSPSPNTSVNAQGNGAVSGGRDGDREIRMVANGGVRVEGTPHPVPEMGRAEIAQPEPEQVTAPRTWREAVAFVSGRDAMLHGHLRHATHLVSFAPPLVTIRVERNSLPGLARRLETVLREGTGDPAWQVRQSEEEGEATLAEQGAEIIQLHRAAAQAHPLVQAAMQVFPTARLGEVTDHALDDYGLPPEEMVSQTLAPDLEFAPLDADLVGEDDLDTDDFA